MGMTSGVNVVLIYETCICGIIIKLFNIIFYQDFFISVKIFTKKSFLKLIIDLS